MNRRITPPTGNCAVSLARPFNLWSTDDLVYAYTSILNLAGYQDVSHVIGWGKKFLTGWSWDGTKWNLRTAPTRDAKRDDSRALAIRR